MGASRRWSATTRTRWPRSSERPGAGTPALDGLGPVGGGFHSEKEYLDLKTLTPRLYLLTKLIMDVGANPPKKTP